MLNPADPVVVSCQEVHAHLAESCIVDCRFDLTRPDWGNQQFLKSHIPGARYLHLDRDLSDQSLPHQGRHPLPDNVKTLRLLGKIGLRPDQPLVVYDQDAGAIAARLWWMAKDAGHRQTYLLDGGYARWMAAGHEVESGEQVVARCTYPGARGHMPTMETKDLVAALEKRMILLVDARDERRFAGTEEPIDRVAGHIPGAINVPFQANLQADGSWKPVTELGNTWRQVLGGEFPASVPIVVSCGSGVTACHNIAALARIGVRSVLYAPSYSGWLQQENPETATGRNPVHDL